jgi:hypothetical protein
MARYRTYREHTGRQGFCIFCGREPASVWYALDFTRDWDHLVQDVFLCAACARGEHTAFDGGDYSILGAMIGDALCNETVPDAAELVPAIEEIKRGIEIGIWHAWQAQQREGERRPARRRTQVECRQLGPANARRS